jgi:hypothetical protein
MKIWALKIPVVGSVCAELNELWIETPTITCAKCSGDISPPADHIEVEWDDGSDLICDFTFASGTIVLKAAIADELLRKFKGFVKGEVRMPDHPALRRPKNASKRRKKRVWLPYEGPELCYMRFTREVALHPSSTVEVETSCEECGVVYKRFIGLEEKSPRHVRRKPGKGFFIERKLLRGDDFFRPKYTGFTLCTDKARGFILERGYKNIDFLEVGDLL